MGIGNSPSSILIALRRISLESGRYVPYNSLSEYSLSRPRPSPLLTRPSWWPNFNVILQSGRRKATGCGYSPSVCHGIHFHTMTHSYAVEPRSSGKNTQNKLDSVARYGGLDSTSLRVGFEKIKELEDADERVRKIFSLEFADDSEIQAYRRNKLVRKIQRDPTDYSLPVRIALTTLSIRAAAKQYTSNKKDSRCKQILLGCVGRRRKQLKYLRKTDYERFEKLLVELGITYTIPPPINARRRHTRRYLEKLTVWRKAREQRLEAMDSFLREQSEAKKREIADLKQELGVEFTEEEMKFIEEERDN